MKDITKKIIQNAYMNLLEQKDADKITVKDIARKGNINRNTFYYHYADIDALVEEIIKEKLDVILEKYPTADNLEEGIDFAIKEALSHKKTILHFYTSSNRLIVEEYLWILCERIVNAFTKSKGEDRILFNRYQTCFLFGLIIDWFNNKMPEKILDDIHYAFNKLNM